MHGPKHVIKREPQNNLPAIWRCAIAIATKLMTRNSRLLQSQLPSWLLDTSRAISLFNVVPSISIPFQVLLRGSWGPCRPSTVKVYCHSLAMDDRAFPEHKGEFRQQQFLLSQIFHSYIVYGVAPRFIGSIDE